MRGLEVADIIPEGGAFASIPFRKGCVPSRFADERDTYIPPNSFTQRQRQRAGCEASVNHRAKELCPLRSYLEVHAAPLDCPSKGERPSEAGPPSFLIRSLTLVRASLKVSLRMCLDISGLKRDKLQSVASRPDFMASSL